MILLDVNLLVYAHDGNSPAHERARLWLDARLSGSAPVGFPWPVLVGFLRLVTNPRIFERPWSAWRTIQDWLCCPVAWIPQPTERHREVLGALLAGHGVRANLVPDAHLAALAIEHGLVLCSTDGDFARFEGLRWQNPLR